MQKITIGSRGSDLALWQANHIKRQLENLGHAVEIKVKDFSQKKLRLHC